MPNGADKKLNFVAKVWDEKAKAYRPIYIAPDATNTVQGDVKLSDATNSTLNAASGMTAATPAAVRAVAVSANNKLDKVTGSDQTVASKVTFNNSIVLSKGATIPTGQYLTGNVSGNATTATTLKNSRNIKLTGRVTGTASFNGGADAVISTTIAAGSIKTADIADGAITAAKLAEGAIGGDSVSFNYAGSSSKGGPATTALKLNTARTISLTGNVTGSGSFDGSANLSIAATVANGAITNAKIADGAVNSAKIADGSVASGDVAFNYAGSSSKGGAATSAAKLNSTQLSNQNLNDYHTGVNFYFAGGGNTCTNKPSGVDNFGMFVFQTASGWWTQLLYGSNLILYSRRYSGSAWSSWEPIGYITDGSITTAKLADNAVTTAKLSNSSVTSAKIVDGTIVATDIANSTITGGKIAANTITATNIAASAVGTSEIAANAVTTAKIANSNVTADKLASSAVITAKIADSAVSSTKIADSAVSSAKIASSAVTSAKIANSAVTLTKLGSDVGTVVVSSTQPSDTHVKLWIKP